MIAHHALVLNLHQPSGNLQDLLDHQTWEAKEILFALDRIPRSLWGHEDLARVHLSLSGTLLETLSDPSFQERVYGIVDCGTLLWHFQNQDLFEILGTGYYHPVLPLIPEADRQEHLQRWLGIAHHLLWRPRFQGFWPPEMGFSMELIPLLRAFGYRYVLVDSEHVEPVTRHELAGAALPPAHGPLRQRRDHRHRARPRPLRRPGVRHGGGLVPQRGGRAHQVVRLPARW